VAWHPPSVHWPVARLHTPTEQSVFSRQRTHSAGPLAVLQYGARMPGWLHAKLLVVFLLIGYHHACGSLLKKFERGANARGHVFYRWFNEVPVLMLLAIVILVVVKPF